MNDQQQLHNSKSEPNAPKRSSLRSVLIALAIIVPIILAIVRFTVWPQTLTYYTDADQIKTPSDQAQLREILWQPPQLLPDPIDARLDAYEARFSVDGLTLYFVRGKAGDNADIYYSEKSYQGWSDPKPIAAINSTYDDLGPEPSQDGQSLYFYSDRPGGQGGYDLWVAHSRADGSGYSVPINLGPRINSEFNDYGPAVTPNGDHLYFSSNRPLPSDLTQPNPNAWPSTLREDLFHRTYDIYMAAITDAGFSKAEPIMSLNTPANEGSPTVSPVDDFLYFASDRPGGSGGFDLYRTRRLRGAHEPPKNLGTTVNTTANDLDPGLTMGGYMLVFSSDQPIQRIDPDKPNPYKLFTTTSREVFRELESLPVSINWAAIWSQVWHNLLWALLALLLILMLLALMGGLQNRKLSLLARCMFASVAAHLLLMLLFNVWNVTSTIAKEFRRRGRIQIALAAPSQGSDLSSQIRGTFTSVEAPTVELVSPERATPSIEIIKPLELATLTVTKTSKSPIESISFPTPTKISEATIKPTIQLTRMTPTKPKSLLPTGLKVDLPNEQKRISKVDTNQPDLPKPANTDSPIRADVSPTLVTSVDAPTLISLTPENNSQNFASDSQTMKPTNIPSREAVPNSDVPPLSLTTLASAMPPPPSLELQLPDNNSPLNTTLEPTNNFEDLSSLKRPTPRAEVSASSLLAEQTKTVAMLEPYTSRLTSSAPTKPTLDTTDSLTATTMTDSFVSPTPGSPTLPLSKLALPAMEQSAESPAAEVTFAYAPTPQSTVRAPMEDRFDDYSITRNRFAELKPTKNVNTEGVMLSQQIQDVSTTIATNTLSPTIDLPKIVPPSHTDTFALALELPTELEPHENPLAQREEQARQELLDNLGGSDKTEAAVELALKWLANHQSADGHWDAVGFDESCGSCGGETDIRSDNALTGLALLCFLGANHTHQNDSIYQNNVSRAINWLLKHQEPNGDIRSLETMYTQGIATIALSEALSMTGDARLREPVQLAASFIEQSRNKAMGGWRYDPGQPGDTSVLGWQIMALKSAQTAGAEVSADNFEAARRWLKRVSFASQPGLYAYQPGKPYSPAMTAEGLYIQQLLGLDRSNPTMQASTTYIMQHLPEWNDNPNTYYWYYATLALCQQQGNTWKLWNDILTDTLLSNQRNKGKAAGSWNPIGEWAQTGGRVYQTAICTLMLEVYYRYLPLYKVDENLGNESEAIGVVRGIVTDQTTGEPVAGANILLNLPDRPDLSVTTNEVGRYRLYVPSVPDHFALSASRHGFAPSSADVSAADLMNSTIDVDFSLEPAAPNIVAFEAVPEVHHLGDDRFEGAINSQFQKESEGAVFAAVFELDASQLIASATIAELTLLVKGVQVGHRIAINGQMLSDRLDRSPRDGSFGEFTTRFDIDMLQPGTNAFHIIAGSRGSDVDDFEFVNVQIRLLK